MATVQPQVSGQPQAIRRRRPVIGRRAAVGGLLIAVAMIATFSAYSSADAPPPDLVLAAARDIRAGAVLAAGDLIEVRTDLPDATSRQAFAARSELHGATALAPLAAGEIVQRSAVLAPDAATGVVDDRREFSLPVDRERALNGDLAPGESVDVLATYGTGESAYTVTVARRARLIEVAETSGGLGTDGRIVAVIALDTADEVLQATHASVAAVVTLVRSTRAGSDEGTDRFAPGDSLDR